MNFKNFILDRVNESKENVMLMSDEVNDTNTKKLFSQGKLFCKDNNLQDVLEDLKEVAEKSMDEIEEADIDIEGVMNDVSDIEVTDIEFVFFGFDKTKKRYILGYDIDADVIEIEENVDGYYYAIINMDMEIEEEEVVIEDDELFDIDEFEDEYLTLFQI